MKDMRNSVNRIVNCETANLNKTIGAAVRQIDNIRLLQKPFVPSPTPVATSASAASPPSWARVPAERAGGTFGRCWTISTTSSATSAPSTSPSARTWPTPPPTPRPRAARCPAAVRAAGAGRTSGPRPGLSGPAEGWECGGSAAEHGADELARCSLLAWCSAATRTKTSSRSSAGMCSGLPVLYFLESWAFHFDLQPDFFALVDVLPFAPLLAGLPLGAICRTFFTPLTPNVFFVIATALCASVLLPTVPRR